MNKLDELSNKYGGRVRSLNRGTNEWNVGGDSSIIGNTKTYVEIFKKFEQEKINFLEIGIFQGRSLAMWCDYFKNGKIYGIDVSIKEFELMKPELEKMGAFKNKNLINPVSLDSSGNQYLDTPTVEEVLNMEDWKNVKFDIIIDDAKHTLKNNEETFLNFYPLLNDGGIYVIEDVNGWQEELKSRIKLRKPSIKIKEIHHKEYSCARLLVLENGNNWWSENE